MYAGLPKFDGNRRTIFRREIGEGSLRMRPVMPRIW